MLMTEPTVLDVLVHIVHERDGGRNIARNAGWRSDVLNPAVPRRGVVPIVDERGAAGARIGCPISGWEEDDGVRRRCSQRG